MKVLLQTTRRTPCNFGESARLINRMTTLGVSEALTTSKKLLFSISYTSEELIFQGKSPPQAALVELKSTVGFDEAKAEFAKAGWKLSKAPDS